MVMRITRPGRRPQDIEKALQDTKMSGRQRRNNIANIKGPGTGPVTKNIRRFSDKNQIILYQVLAGKTTAEIARTENLSVKRVQAIRSSPLFQVRLQQEREALRGTTIEELLRRITSEAVPNFEFLIRMRDNPEDHQDDPRVRLAAARQIEEAVDRVIPKKREVQEDKTVRVLIDQDALRRMHAALQEVKAGPPIAVPFKPVDPEEPWPLEEAEAALRAEEEAAADGDDEPIAS